jgi:two-component system, chemotaxis family, CheB/CheR fusion protein
MTKRRVGAARVLDRSDPELDRTPARGHFPLVGIGAAAGGLEALARPPARLGEVARRLLADAYVPASVLVNCKHECLYSFGATDRYLQASAGEPSRDVVAMARPGLRAKLRSALQQAAKDRTLTTVAGAKVILDRIEVFEVSICVRPTEIEGEELMLVSFVEEVQSVNEELTTLNHRLQAAEGRIVAAQAQADNIINSLHQPLVVLDDELHVVAADRSFYSAFHATPENTIGRLLWNSDDHHLDVPALHAFLQKIRSDRGAVDNCEIEIDMPPRGKRRLLLDACDIQGAPGLRRQILVVIEDITERKQAETALGAAKADAEQANLGKFRFLAAANHDLRQPLQTISLMQGVLLTRVKDEGTVELVGKLGDTVGAMSGMLDALLDVNELEAGMLVPEMVDFSINELLDGLKAEFGYHAGAKGLDWRVVPCRMRVRSDRKLFEQIVRNLLSNAVKYTERGKILIGCRQRAERLRLEVWDTGIGIPGDQLQTIFEEFRQLDNSARERSRGLGLGLSLVRRLGGLLGVSIDVRSRPGSGSVFAVEVPLAEGARDAWQRADGRHAAERTESCGSLLIIEDDPMLLDLLALLFQDEGHQVAAAGDGPQALALASTGRLRPDVIIADYNLPGGMNGVQAITGLREMLQREIPAVIMTGDISQHLAPTNCIQLNKPVKSDDLTSLIRRLLAAPGRAAAAGRVPAAGLA